MIKFLRKRVFSIFSKKSIILIKEATNSYFIYQFINKKE